MKKIIFTLFLGMVFSYGYSQITFNTQPVTQQVCEETDAVFTAVATPVPGMNVLYTWEIKLKSFLPWTTVTPMGLSLIKMVPQLKDLDILDYNTPAMTIKNASYIIDSLEVRLKITQLVPSATETSNEVLLRVFAMPKIDESASVLKGCEPADIQIRMDDQYSLLGLTTCKYELKRGNTSVVNIDDINPGTIAGKFPIKADTTSQYVFISTNRLNAGCVRRDSFDIHIQEAFEQEEIGLVTYNPVSKKYRLIYNVTPSKGTDSCLVFASNMVLKGWTVTPPDKGDMSGVVPANYPGLFDDTRIDPLIGTGRFALCVHDTCGHISGMSTVHMPMHLAYTIDSVKQMISFKWNDYVGFNYPKFYIHRSSSLDSVHLRKFIIDSITNTTDTMNVWTDSTPVKNSYYTVSVNLPAVFALKSALKAESGPYTQSLSSIAEYQVTPPVSAIIYNIYGISVSPNPFSTSLQIEYSLTNASDVSVEVINTSGSIVHASSYGLQPAGNHALQLNIGNSLSEGLYLIKINAGGNTKIIRTIHLK